MATVDERVVSARRLAMDLENISGDLRRMASDLEDGKRVDQELINSLTVTISRADNLVLKVAGERPVLKSDGTYDRGSYRDDQPRKGEGSIGSVARAFAHFAHVMRYSLGDAKLAYDIGVEKYDYRGGDALPTVRRSGGSSVEHGGSVRVERMDGDAWRIPSESMEAANRALRAYRDRQREVANVITDEGSWIRDGGRLLDAGADRSGGGGRHLAGMDKGGSSKGYGQEWKRGRRKFPLGRP